MKKSHHKLEEVREFPKKRYADRRAWLNGIKTLSGCVVCGLSGPPEVLQFDHVRGEKKFTISTSWNQGRARLEEEIPKCEIVCGNCHAIRTKARLGVPEFVPFPKISRLFRDIQVSEKLDGTNATVWVDGEGDVWAGSRTRWITSEDDNFGFARWVEEHEQEFKNLEPCVLRGEWYGQGIQRGYGLKDRRFAVFNSEQEIPDCCERVPVLYSGMFDGEAINQAVEGLRMKGSQAVTGFMNPEGVVVFHTASNQSFKVTLVGDEKPKGSKE